MRIKKLSELTPEEKENEMPFGCCFHFSEVRNTATYGRYFGNKVSLPLTTKRSGVPSRAEAQGFHTEDFDECPTLDTNRSCLS
ncbi:MAG: hypothetical protein OXU51_16105 [Candidatus Poribacteria bacterium]|nr:hypothetical protein [Candidatus Poribacteria bacterium]